MAEKMPLFPQDCPKCAAAAGFPYSAGTVAGIENIQVSLRCHECGQEWELSLPINRASSLNPASRATAT